MKHIPTLITLTLIACSGGCAVSFQPQPDASYSTDAPSPQVDVVGEADVTPVTVDEYYLVGGRYYYWHPGARRYVLLDGRPPRGYRVVRRDRLEQRDRMGRPIAGRGSPEDRMNHAARPGSKPQQRAQQQKKKKPEQKAQ